MEETGRDTLERQLGDADGAVVFLLVLICSLLLSLSASLTQRRQLRLALAGRTEAAASAPPVLPLDPPMAVTYPPLMVTLPVTVPLPTS